MKKVLVIEDEAQTRDIFLRCLSFEGFYALGAESGSVGVTLALAHLPDVIVCDIMMPDLDGYEVLSTLRREPKTAVIPLIFLTAKATMTDLRQGMQLGADDYLTKPCTVEQFLSTIMTRLERQEVLKQWYVGAAQRSHSHAVNNPTLDSPTDPKIDSSSIFPTCPKLSKVFRFIEANYHQSITLNDVAQAAGYSPAYLTNLVQNQTGRTVKQWITERRMTQARTLLTNTAHSIGQIAEAIGYTDVSYFTRLFRQIHGVPPQSWRNSSWRNSVETSTISAQAV